MGTLNVVAGCFNLVNRKCIWCRSVTVEPNSASATGKKFLLVNGRGQQIAGLLRLPLNGAASDDGSIGLTSREWDIQPLGHARFRSLDPPKLFQRELPMPHLTRNHHESIYSNRFS
jgi:hypothetical protein